jgi:hypothetical protein
VPRTPLAILRFLPSLSVARWPDPQARASAGCGLCGERGIAAQLAMHLYLLPKVSLSIATHPLREGSERAAGCWRGADDGALCLVSGGVDAHGIGVRLRWR